MHAPLHACRSRQPAYYGRHCAMRTPDKRRYLQVARHVPAAEVMPRNWSSHVKGVYERITGVLFLLAALTHADAETVAWSLSVPYPVALCDREHGEEFGRALKIIRAELPKVSTLYLVVRRETTPADWRALLDRCAYAGYRVVMAFAVERGDEYEGFRPVRDAAGWDLGPLGDFIGDAGCARHPALFAVQAIDEPWHHRKQPRYATSDLRSLYGEVRRRAAPGASFLIIVQFSREIWKMIYERPAREVSWEEGLCDIAQISALEFQDGDYQGATLAANHTWSRRIIHDRTPALPLWSSIQVFGGRLGPGNGYWFPREEGTSRDLDRLLTDLFAEPVQEIHPLAGIMIQQWDSVSPGRRERQWTLGDAVVPGAPAEQRAAATAALQTLRRWMEKDGGR